MDPNRTLDNTVKRVEIDYTSPIARAGEEQYACIHRERSGVSAGDVSGTTVDISGFRDYAQQEIVDAAFIVYERFCKQTGKRSKLESRLIK